MQVTPSSAPQVVTFGRHGCQVARLAATTCHVLGPLFGFDFLFFAHFQVLYLFFTFSFTRFSGGFGDFFVRKRIVLSQDAQICFSWRHNRAFRKGKTICTSMRNTYLFLVEAQICFHAVVFLGKGKICASLCFSWRQKFVFAMCFSKRKGCALQEVFTSGRGIDLLRREAKGGQYLLS